MSRAAVTVEYRLTALGHSLAAAVSVIKAWANEHIEELESPGTATTRPPLPGRQQVRQFGQPLDDRVRLVPS